MLCKWLVFALAPLLVAAAAPSPAPRGAPLYVVERGDARVYIFGQAAPSDSRWLNEPIERAVGESSELWQENPTGPPDPSVVRLWSRPSGSLFDDLSPEGAARVLRAAQQAGVTRDQLEHLKPWAAGYTINFALAAKKPQEQAGDDVGARILALAQKNNATVRSEFSSWEDFPRFFDAMSTKAQVQQTLYQLDLAERSSKDDAVDRQASDAWARGDPSRLVKANDHLRTAYPALYQSIEVLRNEQWAARIGEMLRTGGVHFIIVGVQHTVGPASIQATLEQQGWVVKRLS
jgi:uncharacterized protein YbaP (TraB family)